MPIKSFRGMTQEDAIERVHLHTNDGSTGYKIKALRIMPVDTGGNVNTANEATLQIFTIEEDAVTQAGLAHASVDFSNPTLIGVAYFLRDQGVVAITSETIIFDNVTFNQDIYVVYKDSQTNNVGMNWHIELEQVKLDLNENTVATLKDIRNITG
jgi:transcriptional regulator of aromatic amino acid metabolism